MVYVAVGPDLVALDSVTGDERWRAQSPTQYWGLAVAHGLVYLGNADGYLYAYDQGTGQERWRFKSAYPAGDEIWSAPAVAGDRLYVGSRDQSVYALEARTGQKLWAFTTAGDAVGDPVVSDGLVYVSDSNHLLPPGARRLHALDAETGREVWVFEVESTLLTTPALADGVLFVTIAGEVIALE
jgi:outer membrane protein assembly factor BamB